ncbi:MAG: hypothetical protein ACOCR6_00965 [archaeon]
MTVRRTLTTPASIRSAIDRQIQSLFESAPSQLATDARRPFEAVENRFRGRFLVASVRALPGRCDTDVAVSAAASVELLFGQAWLNERAAGFVDDLPAAVHRTRTLLASDYLHALAYASTPSLSEDPRLGQSWYRSLERATQRLAAAWVRSAGTSDSEITETVPTEPILMGTAGRLAAVLGDAPEYRDSLIATGTALGITRWRSSIEGTPSQLTSLELPEVLPDAVRSDSIDIETIQDSLGSVRTVDNSNALRVIVDAAIGSSEGACES